MCPEVRLKVEALKKQLREEIAKREDLEKTLNDSFRKYELIIEQSEIGFGISLDNQFIYANETLIGYFGFDSFIDFASESLPELVAPAQKEDLYRQFDLENLNKYGVLKRDYAVKQKKQRVEMLEITTSIIILDNEPFILSIFHDITERKKAEERIREQKELIDRKNTALKEMIEQVRREKEETIENTYFNIEKLVMPVLKKMENHFGRNEYIIALEESMEELTSPFTRKLSSKMLKMTPREIEICNYIKSGLSSKEIARLMNTSPGTIHFHRNNIRIKLGIKNNKTNLRTYLQSM